MPYVYECCACSASSPPVPRRPGAEAYRQRHRDREHGGLVPDGESIRWVPGSTPDPDARYVSTAAVLAVLALLAVASALARATGH